MKKLTLYHEASKGGFKQWSIWLDKNIVTVEWGIVGKTLQRSSDAARPKGKVGTKSYKDELMSAQDNFDRQVRKKREEGYRESMTPAEETDWLIGLDKNFVPAKPLSSIAEDEVNAGLENGTLLPQRKRDGRRHLVLKTRDGQIKIYSRRMEDLTEHLSVLRTAFEALHIPNGTIYDGEVIVDRDDDDDFRATGTFTNSASTPEKAQARIVELEKTGARVKFYAFDVLYYDGNACWALPYTERYELLERHLIIRPDARVVAAEIFPDGTLDSLQRLVVDKGWEGLVLWYANKGTTLRRGGKPKRVGCAKWKLKYDHDVIATGYFLGSGELSSVVGGLNLSEYAPDGVTLRTCGKVGTGFDNALREEMLTWLYPCVITIESDGQEPDSGSFRFPVFKKRHEDKTPEECIGVELENDDE